MLKLLYEFSIHSFIHFGEFENAITQISKANQSSLIIDIPKERGTFFVNSS